MMNMLKTLYEKGYINKTPEQMRRIVVRRLLREIRDEVQESIDDLLENYIVDRISQDALLDLTDVLIDELEIIDEILDKVDKTKRIERDSINDILKLVKATQLTIKKFTDFHESKIITDKLFKEWKYNRVDKDRLVKELFNFYQEELVE